MRYREFMKAVRKFPVLSPPILKMTAGDINSLRVQLAGWKKRGLILSLRKGLYVLNSEDRTMEPSRYYLANQIYLPSYVSLESALSYHGLIPEFVGTTTSVTVRKTSRFKNTFGIFTYQQVLPSGFDGFDSIVESGKPAVLVAKPEKAVVDFLYLNLSKFRDTDRRVFKESYRFDKGQGLDPRRLHRYAKLFSSKKLNRIVDMFIEVALV